MSLDYLGPHLSQYADLGLEFDFFFELLNKWVFVMDLGLCVFE